MPTDDHGLVYPNTTGVAPNGPQQIRDANASVNDQYGKTVATVADLAALTTFPGKTVWVTSAKALYTFDGLTWATSATPLDFNSGLQSVAGFPCEIEVEGRTVHMQGLCERTSGNFTGTADYDFASLPDARLAPSQELYLPAAGSPNTTQPNRLVLLVDGTLRLSIRSGSVTFSYISIAATWRMKPAL